MSDATITFTGKADQLLGVIDQLNAKNKKLEAGLVSVGKASRENSKAEREALAVTKSVATAHEVHAQKLGSLKKHYDEGRISLETYNRSMKALKVELAQSTNAAGNFLAMIAKMGGAAVAIKAVGGALAGEFDRQKQREQKASDEGLSYGEVLRRTTSNFSADKSLGLDALDPAYAGIQTRQGVKDRKSVARVSGNAFSARGQRTNAEALQFVEEAFRYSGGDEEIANVMAARALDVSKQTGEKDPKAILGWLSETQKAARVDSMSSLGKQGVVAMLGATAHGASAEESAELFATINSLMSDEEGANSKTAMLQLTGQLMDDKKIGKAGLSKAFAGKGVMQRLATLQGDQKLADKFMKAEGVSFEVAAEPFINKLVRGDKDAMALLAESRATVPALGVESAKAFDSTIAAMDSNPHTQLSNIDRASQATEQADELDKRRKEAIAAQAQKIFDKVLNKVDLPGFDESPGMWIPGQRDLMKGNVAINRKVKGLGGAAAVGTTMKMMSEGGYTSELGGHLSPKDNSYLLEQLIEINKLQLQEQKLDRERANRAVEPAAPAPPAPAVSLLDSGNGGDPAMYLNSRSQWA